MSESTEVRRRVFEVLNRYRIVILAAVPAIIGLTVGIVYLQTSSKRQVDKVWNKMWEVGRNRTMSSGSGAEDERAKAVTRAINEYNYIMDEMSPGDVAPWVLFQLGNTYYESGDYDGALDAYGRFLKDDRNHYLAPFVTQLVGYAYEEKGQFQDAIDQFKKITLGVMLPQKGLDIGRCYEKLGMRQPAIDAYSKVIELEGTENNWVSIAQYRIDALK